MDPRQERDHHPSPGSEQPLEEGHQPYLHDRHVLVAGPTLVICGEGGTLAGEPDGFYTADRRLIRRMSLRVDGAEVVPIGSHRDSPCTAVFRSVVRGLGQHGPDPAVTARVERTVRPDSSEDRIVLTNSGRREVTLGVRLDVEADTATMSEVKSGLTGLAPRPEVAATATGAGLQWSSPDHEMSVEMEAEPRPGDIDASGPQVGWKVIIPAGQRRQLTVVLRIRRSPAPLFAPATGERPWAVPSVEGDTRLERLLGTALADIEAMLLDDRAGADGETTDRFVAAGAPWFLTLFGRDSLWTARMLLPLSTDLAAGTLRVLARRQGAVVDPDTEEQPGKILHELRPEGVVGEGNLPARYFGTIDATPLWVTLLHDAWRWGLEDDQVEALLPAAESALAWMADFGDPDGDGFLEYAQAAGTGLANQGWRDSSDAIRWNDGRLARPPIALAEVQAYAFQAAQTGADLLDGFGRPGADRWREWAGQLKRRFHRRFWIEVAGGSLPAVALDGDGQAVDSATSALGHLLGTGLLEPEQASVVANRLAQPDLDAGYGLRTLSSDAVGFNPLGYHTGSIWPHDTAIAAFGLRREGFTGAAWSLINGLLDAASAFDYRLPELFAGHGRAAGPPGPYPAACRPQAWAAAAASLTVQTLLGLEPDVPGGRLKVTPMAQLHNPLRVRNLRIMGQPLSVAVDRDGSVDVDAPDGLSVHRHV